MARPKPRPKAKASHPSPYQVTFHSEGISAVSVLLNDTAAQITGGYGGWTVTSRQQRIGLTMWQGKDPIRMALSILFDGYMEGVSQEVSISRLSRMALPPTPGEEPPVVTISGSAVPRPGPTKWVIENLQWGTNVIWDRSPSAGNIVRLRQDCVVNLIQYVAEDRAAFSSILPHKTGTAKKPGSKGYQKPTHPKQATKHSKPEHLQKVANRVYKSPKPGDWKLIAQANDVRDPRNAKTNKPLKIPKK